MSVPRELGEPLLVALAQGLGLSHAPNTVADYVYKLRKLFAFLRARGIDDVGLASVADLQAFREHLAETPTEHGPPDAGPSEQWAQGGEGDVSLAVRVRRHRPRSSSAPALRTRAATAATHDLVCR